VYREQTAPLSGWYRSQGLLCPIDAMGEIEQVSSRALAALGAADPSAGQSSAG
jgi:adenylate kinase